MVDRKLAPKMQLALGAMAAVTIVVAQIHRPDFSGIDPLQVLRLNLDVAEWIVPVVGLFVWGIGINVLFGWLTRDVPPPREELKPFVLRGCIASLVAGVFEEAHFRFLLFFGSMVWVLVLDKLFFGAMAWMHLHLVGPIADVTSFRALHDVIFHPSGWHVGAAMLYANSLFHDDHAGQGWFNHINSWFVGLFFFWLLMHGGLLACVLVHFLYDLSVVITHQATVAWKVRRMVGSLPPPGS